MRHIVNIVVVGLFAAGTLPASTNSPITGTYATFDMPAAELPAGCVPSDLSPKEKTSRPLVLSAEQHIRAFCEEDLHGLLDYAATKEMFILCFKEKNEVGIYGWRLASPESANALFTKASAKYEERAADMKLWVNNEIVVLLWRDKGVTDACFQTFQEHVARTINKTQ